MGKIGVPDSILTKPASLTDDEYEQIKTHSLLGARIAEGVLDDEQVSWVRSHHERPDGSGYPDALRRDSIPDGALLLGVADAYDTMTSGRPYRQALSVAEAIRELRSHAGTQFDPGVVYVLERWALEREETPGTSAGQPQAA